MRMSAITYYTIQYMRRPLVISYMTLHPIPSEFPYVFGFFFQCAYCRFCSVACWREAEASYHPWECGIQETVSTHVRQSRVLDSFPEYFRLGFRLLARNLPTAAAQADQLLSRSDQLLSSSDQLLSRSDHLNVMSLAPHQREADFESVFSLCSGCGEGSLEKEFWVFIIVLFYLEVLRRKNYFIPFEEGRRKETEDKMAKLLFKIIKVTTYN
jgi:hypothetical protein